MNANEKPTEEQATEKPPETLTPPQVARRWNCKVETVHRLIERDLLPAFSLSPPDSKKMQYKVRLMDVIAFEESGGTLPPRPPKPARRRKRKRRMEVEDFYR